MPVTCNIHVIRRFPTDTRRLYLRRDGVNMGWLMASLDIGEIFGSEFEALHSRTVSETEYCHDHNIVTERPTYWGLFRGDELVRKDGYRNRLVGIPIKDAILALTKDSLFRGEFYSIAANLLNSFVQNLEECSDCPLYVVVEYN